MDSTRKRILLPTAIIITLVLAPVLAACSSPPPSAVDQGGGGSVEPSNTAEPSDAAGPVDIDGLPNDVVSERSTLPEGFPKEIPLVSGTIVSGGGFAKPASYVWNVSFLVSDGSALVGIASQLEGAGFSSQVNSDSTAGNFDKAPYHVLVVVYKDDAGRFIAIYTVEYKKPGS